MSKRTNKQQAAARVSRANPTHVSTLPTAPPVLAPGKKLGTMDVAARLGCHPMTVQRLVDSERISKPIKWFGKNLWTEEQLEKDIAKLLARTGKSPEAA